MSEDRAADEQVKNGGGAEAASSDALAALVRLRNRPDYLVSHC